MTRISSTPPGNTSNWTGRVPRTMTQAFGPTARVPRRRRASGRLTRALAAAAWYGMLGGLTVYAFVVATA